MAYENLLKSVEENAQERERELRERAKAVSDEIRAEARKEAEEIQGRAIQEAERSAAIERNKQLFLVKGEIKQSALKSQEKIYVAAFDEAGKQLARLREDTGYPAIFRKLAAEATAAVGGAPFRVHVDRRDFDLGTRTLAELGFRCEILADIETAGGLVISSPDGLVVISNTVESRLGRIRERRRREIHAILAGG